MPLTGIAIVISKVTLVMDEKNGSTDMQISKYAEEYFLWADPIFHVCVCVLLDYNQDRQR